jgi:Zn-dependent peptidase ImmA (M78 family)
MNPEDVKLKSIPSVKNYRTLYGTSTSDNSAINIAMLDLLDERDFLIETNHELEIPLPAFNLSITLPEDPIKWAAEIRRLFDIRLDTQYRCTSARKFYLYLREKIEAVGIFVHCFTDVPIETARGLAIYDSSMPIIGLNDEDRQPAKSFSMIHELVHIFKRESSLCNDIRSARREEVFCNAVAGEVLVPTSALNAVIQAKEMGKPFSKYAIEQLAKKFSVSKDVIIRRLLDTKRISQVEHDAYADEFRRDVELQKEEQRIARQEGRKIPGPTREVSREAIDRTSATVCRTLYHGYGNDIFSKQDIARHLGISQKYVNKFLTEVSTWNK